MRHLLLNALVGSGLLFGELTVGAFAQGENYGQQMYQYERHGAQHTQLFSRLRSDLDQVAANSAPGSPNRLRVDRALRDTNDLQNKVLSGTYDEHDLKHAAMSIDRVLNENPMPSWQHDRLSADLNRLQNLNM